MTGDPAARVPAGLSIVPLETLPVPDVLGLLRSALGDGPFGRGPEMWSWKHRQSPFGSSPGLAAVADDGTLAGVRLFLRWRWLADGRTLEAARAVDTATAPGWQRRGVFRALTLALVEQMRTEGCDLIFNTPNPRSAAGYLRMGWTAVGRLPLWFRPLRPLRLLKGLLRRRQEGGAPTAEPPGSEAPHPTRPISELLAEPALASFLDRPRGDEPRIHTRRNADYLAWRYQPPAEGPRYGALWRFEGGSSAVAVARRRRRRGLTEVTLCEVVAGEGPDGVRTAAGLIDKIAAESDADYLVACAPRRSPERAVLRSAGFLPVGRRGPLLTVRPLSPAGTRLGAESWTAWRASVGDLELF